mgnify:CR=1 FL=1
MTFLSILGFSAMWLAFMVFAWRRALTYLHAYQQEEYDSLRFWRWMRRRLVFDTRLSAALIVYSIAGTVLAPPQFVNFGVLIVLFLGFAGLESSPFKKAKKKLVLTQRAKRILGVALVLAGLAGGGAIAIRLLPAWIVAVQFIPFALMLGNALLTPYERRIQAGYWREAYDKIQSLKPRIIGVTGSFGKTSVKHILGHVLSSAAPTMVTAGSINTPMGIARSVREQLQPHHRYFVCEMGAYGPGSIGRLCALAEPDMAVVTAIGHAHYERFKTLDAVASTKYELVQSVLARAGTAVVHEQTLEFQPSREIYQEWGAHFVLVGDSDRAHLRIHAVAQAADGLKIDITWEGADYRLEVPLYGQHHGANVAICFAVGCQLGLDPEQIRQVLKSVPQIPHRLEVRDNPGSYTVIDDAYNANPAGLKAALEVLDLLHAHRNGMGRRILVTPGMIEMGAAHDAEHAEIGRLAAHKADIVLAVVPGRIPSFVEAFRTESGRGQDLHEMPGFAAAQDWLSRHAGPQDIVLLANDLPDIYETRPAL